MIFDIILTIIYFFAYGLLAIIGGLLSFVSFTLPNDWAVQVANTWLGLRSMNQIFPFGDFVVIVGLMFGFESVLFMYKLLKWSWKKIPGIG